MKLIAVYVAIVIVGMFAAYLVGLVVEQWSMTASLPVFLTMFFGVFWVGWRLAVRLT